MREVQLIRRHPDLHHTLRHQLQVLWVDSLLMDEAMWTDPVAHLRLSGPAQREFASLVDLVVETPLECRPHLIRAAYGVTTNLGMAVCHALWSSETRPCPFLVTRVLRGDSPDGRPVTSTVSGWELDDHGGVSFTTTIGQRTQSCLWIRGPHGLENYHERKF